MLAEHFYPTTDEPTEGIDYALLKEGLWVRPGEPVTEVIARIAGLDEAVAEDVRTCLSDLHGTSAVMDGGEDPYADDALYEEEGPDDVNFRDTWESFCQHLRWRSRFFTQDADVDLDNIFGDLGTVRTIKGEPTIREISPADDDRFVFRARVAQSWQEMQKILECPSKELGAPPPRLSRTGRMNAAGISVFYGAQDRNTSVAEKRGTVGSHVVVGRFEVIRTIQVLDLDVLAKVYVEGSHFDPEFAMQRGRAKFLGHLVEEISRPVMPGDEAFDYLPTQVVSEYLATRVAPKVDGIVFNSSQTGGVGRNLVLFNHASRAEPDDVPPGTGFTMLLDPGAEDDPNLNIAIFEEGPPGGPSELKDRKVVSGVPVDKRPPVRRDGAWLPDPDPIFRLDASSVQVLKIKAVSYDWSELSVTRHRRTEVQPR